MYETITYEQILKRMLSRIPSNMDKREGGIIYDALAPAAVELQLMYIELDIILKETFADTASREFLIRRGKEKGLVPKEATYAVLKGIFNVEVPIGSRYRCQDLSYVVIKRMEDKTFSLQCETVGRIGNKNFGDLIPIDYIDGLETARLTDLLIPGEEEEETQAFRKRYFASFETKAYGGNVDDYMQKTNSIQGVGITKVTPAWNGGGTVKLTILDSEFNKASAALVHTVQQTIDPTQSGSGIGIAPIGHVVTVETAEEVVLKISLSITLDTGYPFDSMKTRIEEVISDYLLELRKEWDKKDSLLIRIAQIESRILSMEGVLDIGNTRINGQGSNLALNRYQIPVLGGVISD